MTTGICSFVIFLILIFTVESANSAPNGRGRKPAAAAAVKKPVKGRVAVVTAEFSQVYEKPDLDAKVVTVAKRGMRLPVSKGTRGEYAKFFKTRANGKTGWILTLDVKSEAEAKKFFVVAKAAEYKRGPFDPEEDEGKPGRTKEPFVFAKSINFAIGQSGYKESINGVDYTANLLTYGLKLTGPDIFLTGPLMDVNILLHYGAPEYYTPLSSITPSGFILWTDANLLLPVLARQDFMVGVGAGPILIVSNIQASQGSTDYGMWSLNIGADIELTAGMRFDDFCVRIDGKYIFEKKSYHQVQLSAGTVF